MSIVSLYDTIVVFSTSGVPGANGEKGDRGPRVRVFQGCKVTEEALDFLVLLAQLVHLGVQDNLVKMAYRDCLVI